MKRSYILLGSMFGVMMGGLTLSQCSGDTNGTADGGDAAGDVIKADACKGTKCGDGGGGDADAAPVVVPNGKELYPSDSIQIFGITTDGLVIFADNATSGSTVYAADVGGTNPPVKIGTPKNFALGIAGKVVFIWDGITSNTAQVGALSLWVSGGTLKLATAKSAPNGGFASSVDGSLVMFTANSNTLATVGDFIGGKNDGSGQATLVTGVDIVGGTNGCRPVVGFATNTVGVTSTCTVSPPDGGVPSATISTYAVTASGDGGTAWAPTQIATGALDLWSTDTAGDKILVATPAGLTVYPIGGGVGIPIDNKDIENGLFTFGYLNKAGSTVLYSTPAGAYYTTPTLTPIPATIQASGAKVIRSLSPDESHSIYSTTFDSQQFGSDLYLTSNTANATATTLINTTSGALFGLTSADDFTSDSKYAIFIQALNASLGTGDLYALAVGGGSPVKLASGEWQNLSASASKIIYTDNCPACSATANKGAATADLHSIDVSSSTPTPVLLQAGVDIPLVAGANATFVTPAKDRVIYTYSQNTASTGTVPLGGNGLYSIPIP